MTTQQPEALRLAEALDDGAFAFPDEISAELRRLHAENETLRAGYAAARLEIESLRLRAPRQGVAYAALPESFLEIPDVQDESGINTYYSREVVLECIDAALASHGQARADSVQEDAARWREHVGKLDALVAYCPTCCQGFIAKQDMTRDEVLFACGKAVGQSGAKRLREALDLAVDHIDMDALRISHCKDAAVIDAARKQGASQ